MKKLLFSIMTVAALASCSSNEENAPVQEYGTISFALTGTSGTPSISVGTRADNALSYDAAKTYNISISNTTTSYSYSNTLASMTNNNSDGTFSLPVANGYKATAESITENEANINNSYWGQLRLVSGETEFNVTTSGTTTVTLNCAVANSRLSFGFDESCANVFSSYSVEVTSTNKGGNKLTFENTATTSSPIAYFNAGDAVSYTIKATRIDGQELTFTSTSFNTEAKKWYKKTVKVTETPSGTISLKITTNTTMDVESKDVTVNPYDGSSTVSESNTSTSTEEVTAE